MNKAPIPPSIKSYSRATVAELLAISDRQLDRLIVAGHLRSYRIGSRGIRITEASIQRYIESSAVCSLNERGH